MLKRETTPDLADTVVPVVRFPEMEGAAYYNSLLRERAVMTTSRYVCATRRSKYRIAYVLVRRNDPRILLVMRHEQTARLQGCAGWHVPVRPSNYSGGGQVGPDGWEGRNPVSQAHVCPFRRRAPSTTAVAIVVLATTVRATVVLATTVRATVVLAIVVLATAVRVTAVRVTCARDRRAPYTRACHGRCRAQYVVPAPWTARWLSAGGRRTRGLTTT